jgi:hypothetical protein
MGKNQDPGSGINIPDPNTGQKAGRAGIQVYLLISVNFLANVSGSRTAKSMRIRVHNTAYGGYYGAISVRKIVLLLIVLLFIVLDCFNTCSKPESTYSHLTRAMSMHISSHPLPPPPTPTQIL